VDFESFKPKSLRTARYQYICYSQNWSLKEQMTMALTLLSIASPRTNLLAVAFKLILEPVVAMAAAVPVALPGCADACGNITVPYPLGVGKSCFRVGFTHGLFVLLFFSFLKN
jgi:hypothetical protein